MTKSSIKKEQAIERFEQNVQVFACPICRESLFLSDLSALSCASNHSFDFARNGYVNLFVGQSKTQYDKDLFRARRQVFAAGIYRPLIVEIGRLLMDLKTDTNLVLDAGCGEGSLLAQLHPLVSTKAFLGVDISKEGIMLAGAHQVPCMWCVADLAKLPLRDTSIDVILNVLSPANYEEFRRVLKPNGVVLKVIPGEEYLHEIRMLLGISPYSNDEVLINLGKNLTIEKRIPLYYQVPVTESLWLALVDMTPLTQHRRIKGDPPEFLTIDLQVIQASNISIT